MLPSIPALALALSASLARSSPSPCSDSSRATSSFEFASNPWLNLFNFLFKEAKHSRGIEDDGVAARGYLSDDTAAVRPLTPSELTTWNGAIAFFADRVIRDKLGVDSLALNINGVLANASTSTDLEESRLPHELTRVLLTAMPIYRWAWWPNHDRRNEQWIASMREALAKHESCLTQRAEAVFRSAWPGAPIHVDATVYASWFGAYSTHHPTRITVSANAQGSQELLGLETLLHETGHAMLASVDSALASEAVRQHKELPREFSHLVLFYTAGELIREEEPGHVPFAERFVWRQSNLARRYHDAIEQEWRPYLAGSCSFEEAIASLIGRLP